MKFQFFLWALAFMSFMIFEQINYGLRDEQGRHTIPQGFIVNTASINRKNILFAPHIYQNKIDSTKPSFVQSQEKPNVLWITSEDIRPYLGSYVFEQAYTPNL